mgnify:CR=1 FL=1
MPTHKGIKVNQEFLGFLLAVTALLLFLLIFVALFYLWNKTSQLEVLATKRISETKKSAGGGTLLGFEGQQIWQYLVSDDSDPTTAAELRSRYGYILQRHLESIVEQAFFDSRRNKTQVPANDLNVGGTRGEVRSWLPGSYVQVIYDSAQKLAREDGVWPSEGCLAVVAKLLGELKMGDLHDTFKERMSTNMSRLRVDETQASSANGKGSLSSK